MEGKIGMGAALEVTPFVHVARLVAFGRFLADEIASTELACAGDGRGDGGRAAPWCGTAGALSRATSERRSHDEVFEVMLGEASGESLPEISDCLRPNSRDDDDFRRRGSKASWKYS
jgi:hypothetical protein